MDWVFWPEQVIRQPICESLGLSEFGRGRGDRQALVHHFFASSLMDSPMTQVQGLKSNRTWQGGTHRRWVTGPRNSPSSHPPLLLRSSLSPSPSPRMHVRKKGYHYPRRQARSEGCIRANDNEKEVSSYDLDR